MDNCTKALCRSAARLVCHANLPGSVSGMAVRDAHVSLGVARLRDSPNQGQMGLQQKSVF